MKSILFKLSTVIAYISLFTVTNASKNEFTSNTPYIYKKPIELEWKNTKWQEIDFSKISLSNKSSLFISDIQDSPLYYISIIFSGGKYSSSIEEQESLEALTEIFQWNILENNHPVCKNEKMDNIDTELYFNENGQTVLQLKGLKQYLDETLQILSCFINNPSFTKNKISDWKKQKISKQKYFLEANSHTDQLNIARNEAFHLAFNQYFKNFNQNDINNVNQNKLNILQKSIMQSNGMKLIYLGDAKTDNVNLVIKFMNRITYGNNPFNKWFPEKLNYKISKKIKAKIIVKPEMAQSNVILNYYYPDSRYLNSNDYSKLDIITEVYYSDSIGADRFSKALRSETGFSYSPYAYYDEDIFYKGSEGRVFSMSYESPNEKVSDAVFKSIQTWDNFLEFGMSEFELNTSRNTLMNKQLTNEYSFTKILDRMNRSIADNKIPNNNPTQYLAALDNQKNVVEMNSTIKKVFLEPSIPVLIIIGNPYLSEIEKLKNDHRFESVEVIPLDEYQKTLMK